ncbi:helix-turn-helix domain-containing protein [Cellulomonas triticagri]|uniref:helix-turn-helix domain-containing protein n=1 Tax=Cellulomonas triticagri TaxID=2483352 RepID=UPI001F19B47B|nr:AraC family transcriptional regulator [Cellulomonas triticagri]
MEFRITTNHFPPAAPGRWARHHHAEHELLWGARGLLTVETDDGWFAVPATAGLWIPAGTAHTVESSGGTGFFCSYLTHAPEAVGERTTAVTVPPVVAELFRTLSTEELPDPVRARCEQVVLDLLRPVEVAPMVLPMPTDPRLLAVARTLLRQPDDARSVAQWAAEQAMSVRHLSRRFAQETGMTFEQWRLHARVRVALGLLAQGMPVAAVGRRVGYASASAFVQAFARVMGHTPGWYQSDHAGDAGVSSTAGTAA